LCTSVIHHLLSYQSVGPTIYITKLILQSISKMIFGYHVIQNHHIAQKCMDSWILISVCSITFAFINNIHSFISNICIVPFKKLLRGAPNSSTAKKKRVIKTSKEHRWESSGQDAELQREAIPGRGAHHRGLV